MLKASAQTHTSFYRFVSLAEPELVATFLREQCATLKGMITVAHEGISGAVAGAEQDVRAFEQALQQHSKFVNIRFKHSACTTPPFSRMKVQLKPELVQVGIKGLTPRCESNARLSPAAWRELLQHGDTVLLDNRNTFEFKLGHFKGAVDPQVSNFRDFPDYIKAHAPQWKADGKRVAMYCTGGIRCEKTSAWVRSFGVEVAELEGGILNYFAQMPDAEKDFEGECFVFDNRIAIDTKLQETKTRPEDVFADEPDGEWRLARARRLAGET